MSPSLTSSPLLPLPGPSPPRFSFPDPREQRSLYPCIGLDSHCCVTANFGSKAFAFDVPTFEACFTGAAPKLAEADDYVRPSLAYTEYHYLFVEQERVLREVDFGA